MQPVQSQVEMPIDRRYAGAGGAPVAARANGAVLFADLSGFTNLTTDLVASRGARGGAEAVARHLDECYETLIGQVHRFGGAVVDFSGDAITCWFDDTRPAGSVGGAARAVSAAWTMRSAVPALKCGVAAGTVRRLLVGDPRIRSLDVIVGAPVVLAAFAEAAAARGDVVTDAGVARQATRDGVVGRWQALPHQDLVRLRSLDGPAPSAPWPQQALGTSDPTSAIGRDVSAELRPVVTLFCRYPAIDLGAIVTGDDGGPDVPDLDVIVRWVQEVAHRHGGVLVQVTTGDKGGYLYVAFGAPVASRDLADQAVACALALRDTPPPTAGLAKPAIGIDHGMARTGVYGAAARRSYGVIGAAANTAAQLMVLAGPGEVLLSATVVANCRRRIRCRPAGDAGAHVVAGDVLSLKGYPVVGHDGLTYGSLVGRDRELASLTDVLSRVRHGEGGVVVVTGEPGVGKSHLVEEARRHLSSRPGTTWLATSANPSDRTSLHAFLPFLRDLFHQDLGPDPTARRALLELGIAARAGERAARLVGHLGPLLGHHVEGSDHQALAPAARCATSMAAIVELVRAECAQRPVILHVRDAQWLDGASERLVHALIDLCTTAPLGLLIEDRRGPDRWSREHGSVETITVAPFDRDGVRHLAVALTGSEPDPAQVDAMWAATGGNALYGELVLSDPTWPAELPDSLVAAIVARLDGLTDAARDAVVAAAVLGRSFTAGTLAAVLDALGDEVGVPDRVPAAVTNELVATGLWRPVSNGWAFCHELVCEVALTLPVGERLRPLHAAAARVLAAGAADADPLLWVRAARHEEAAGHHRRAVVRWQQAGRAARDMSMMTAAADHHARAAALAASAGFGPPTRARLHRTSGELALIAGAYATATEQLAAAATATPGGTGRTAEALTRLGEAWARWGRTDEAEEAFERALARAVEVTDSAMISRIFTGLAIVHASRGRIDDGARLALLALNLAGEAPAMRARAAQELCDLQRRRNLPTAVEYGQEAVALWDEVGGRHGRAVAQTMLAKAQLADGDTAAALASARSAEVAFDALGDTHGMAIALDTHRHRPVGSGGPMSASAIIGQAGGQPRRTSAEVGP